MAKAYLIDVTAKEVREIDYDHTKQRIGEVLGIGNNPIDVAASWGVGGPALYVDDEGLLHDPKKFFSFAPRRDGALLAGNGLLVGREVETPDKWWHEDVPFTKDEVERWVTFFWRD